MILYNVTLKVEDKIHDEWFAWMKQIHIPDVLRTGLFTGYRMSRLLDVDDSEGPTYSIQYMLNNMEDLEHYKARFAPGLQKEHTAKYKDKVLAFRTIMAVVSEAHRQ